MGRRKPPPPQGLSWRSLKAEWLAWYATKSPVFHFGLKFGVLLLLFYGLLLTPVCDRLLYGYLEANAWLSNLILHALGQASHLSGVTISSSRFAMAIRRGCDAVEPTWLFCAAVLSFPGSWRKKAAGIAAGALFLQALNLVRVVSLYFIGVYFPPFFNPAHLEIWPVVFILAAILLWMSWMRWSKQNDVAA